MLVMTAKVDKKKIVIILGAIVAAIAVIAFLFSGSSVNTGGSNIVTGNDDRVQFLASFGWEVVTSPAETSQVRIPAESSEVFDRYNALQKSMGYDLSAYQGKTVMRYVYKIKNYPGATEPVYATILISSNQVIGGDITDTSATGVVQGFEKLTNNN
jgi:hypothetical protein